MGETRTQGDDPERMLAELLAARRRLHVVVVVAALVTLLFAAYQLLVQDALRGSGELSRVYYTAYALTPLLLALGAAGLFALFKGRSWFRSLVAYAAVMLMAVPSAVSVFKEIAQAKARLRRSGDADAHLARMQMATRKMEILQQRIRALAGERLALQASFEHEPPLSPAALASPQLIEANLERMRRYVGQSDELIELQQELRTLAPQGATPEDAAALVRMSELIQRATELDRDGSRKVIQALEVLRQHAGRWRLDGKMVEFSVHEAEAAYNAAVERGTELFAQAKQAQKAAELEVRRLNSVLGARRPE